MMLVLHGSWVLAQGTVPARFVLWGETTEPPRTTSARGLRGARPSAPIAAHPFAPNMIWIRGMGGQITEGPMEQAAQELDHGCGARTSRLFMRDEGYEWKQRIFPERDELPWRIEVREYDCGAASPNPVFRIPGQ